ncbi:MAG: hypothetical protein NTY47_06500 [Candidatus Omnitrophica bacterium]|nr:hypothetical protein [Candidatus Omnitrophota bacterium]
MYKKRLIFICLFAMIISAMPCVSVYPNTIVTHSQKSIYKRSLFNKMLYKTVVLGRDRKRPVLVNRITGEVKYILMNNKEWRPLSGMWKQICQSRYDEQVSLKK